MTLSLQHPTLHTWDFTTIPYKNGLAILFLNTDKRWLEGDQHHQHARIGLAYTENFRQIQWIDDCVFGATADSWANTSIWSTDIVRRNGRYWLFFTSRTKGEDDGFTQHIGLASSTDLIHWRREPLKISADPTHYLARGLEGDDTVHAWRDPYLFLFRGQLHMILTAKSPELPLGKNGCIALLQAKQNSFFEWEAMPPLYAPGYYSEMEEPDLFYNKGGELVLTFSSHDKFDHTKGTTSGRGGLYAVNLGSNLYSPYVRKIENILPYQTGIYAAHIMPSIEGEIIGFDLQNGGFRRSGVKKPLMPARNQFLI